MAGGLTDFYASLGKEIETAGEFQPRPYYNPEGDTLFFYARDVQSYAKRHSPTLTLFLAADDNSLVGFKIKGLRRILRTMERLGKDKFVMREPGIRLNIFVQFALIAAPDDPSMESYESALEQFNDVIVDEGQLQLI